MDREDVDRTRSATAPDSHLPGAVLTSDPTDRDLLAACRRGTADAWNVLVDRYERLVFAVARYEGLPRDDAADVTQQTFEALLDQLETIADGDRLRWWLMSVARRQSWRTRDRNRRETPVTSGADRVDEPSVSDGADERAEVLALRQAMNQLGEPCRTLLQHLYFDPSEPTFAQVATRLGRSENGIGPSRSRCLARLRHILESISVDG